MHEHGSQFKERCPPRHTSRVERLTAKVEPLLTKVTVDSYVANGFLSNLTVYSSNSGIDVEVLRQSGRLPRCSFILP